MMDVNSFIQKLNKIADDLEELGREFSELYTQYEGNDFENQHFLATNALSDLLLISTHETATNIGFRGVNIKTLTDFIDFRRTNKKFTDEELEMVIDSPTVGLGNKIALAKKLTSGNVLLLLDTIRSIQHSWNRTFGNKSYQYIKKQIAVRLE